MSKPPITFEIIKEKYIESRAHYQNILNERGFKWKIEPKGVELLLTKTDYGLALLTGEIQISSAFIGTTAYSQLWATLIHEFAHLAVGIEQNHNRRFRDCYERCIGLHKVPDSDLEQIRKNLPFKWSIIAVMVTGERIDFKMAHKKAAMYTQYPNGKYAALELDDVLVKEFVYILNHT